MEEQTKKSAQPTPSVPSVGTRNKEAGINTSLEHISEKPVISAEVQNYVSHSEPQVPVHEQFGIKPAAESTPVKSSNSVILSMSEKEIEEVLKNNIKDDFSGLEFHKGFEDKHIYFTKSVKFEATLFQKIKERARRLISKLKISSPKPV